MVSKSLVEITFHGRGGQGSVTAANLLVSAALIDGNRGVQAFPFFGAERRGAPVRAFARISEEEIHLRSEIYNPDVVIVLDESIMDIVDVLKGVKENGKILINTTKHPKDFDFSKKYNVATVDGGHHHGRQRSMGTGTEHGTDLRPSRGREVRARSRQDVVTPRAQGPHPLQLQPRELESTARRGRFADAALRGVSHQGTR